MVRTQVSLDEKEYEAAKLEAERLGISFAELVRRAVRSMVPTEGDDPPWMNYAGLVESGDPSSSSTIDEIVYAEKP